MVLSTWHKFLMSSVLASAAYTVKNSAGIIRFVFWHLVQLWQGLLVTRKRKGWSTKNKTYLEAARSWLPGLHHVVARWEGGGGRRSGIRRPCTPSAGRSPSPPGRTLAAFVPAFRPVLSPKQSYDGERRVQFKVAPRCQLRPMAMSEGTERITARTFQGK